MLSSGWSQPSAGMNSCQNPGSTFLQDMSESRSSCPLPPSSRLCCSACPSARTSSAPSWPRVRKRCSVSSSGCPDWLSCACRASSGPMPRSSDAHAPSALILLNPDLNTSPAFSRCRLAANAAAAASASALSLGQQSACRMRLCSCSGCFSECRGANASALKRTSFVSLRVRDSQLQGASALLSCSCMLLTVSSLRLCSCSTASSAF
mmetsp:Transcript_436/g.1155  ORF Transcript_436/g.1155 Transcript_436/m.1155 type:complete len:207 (-) Transcript_436:301-921(-)